MDPKSENGEGKTAKGEESEGKGSKEANAAPKKVAFNKARLLYQVALDPNDDERKATSKKISWILRKGADKVGIEQMSGGWVKMSDLLTTEILDDIPDRSEEKFMSIITESNTQKLRYETKQTNDGVLLRALTKAERKPQSKEKESFSNLQVEGQSSKLRADAKAFVPQAASGQPMMPDYTPYTHGYPGFGAYWPYSFAGFPTMPQRPGSKRYQGRIKSYNAEKGFGFIESVEAWAYFNRDVYLHKAHIGDFQVGDYVTFVTERVKDGMPRARLLQAMPKDNGEGEGEKGKDNETGKDEENNADATAEALEPGQVTTESAPSAAGEAPAPAPEAAEG